MRQPYSLMGQHLRQSRLGDVFLAFCRNRRGWVWMAPDYLSEWSCASYRDAELAFRSADRIMNEVEAKLAA